MRNIFLIESKSVSFGKVELWKVHDFYQVRCKGTLCESTHGYKDLGKAVEMYSNFR